MAILFFSGAGLSADSGLPTFRDAEGLWDKYNIDDVCNILTWKQNYELVHEFYNKRRIEYKDAMPNAMHKMIADIQKERPNEVTIITQNVDTLLEKAGCVDIMHVHGRIDRIHCAHCKKESYIEGEFLDDMVCECGCKKFKPSIVFFGESAPLYRDMYRAFESLKKEDFVVIIGTNGSVVQRDMILGDKTSGIKATRILCNLEKSKYIEESHYDYLFYDKAVNVIDKIRAILDGTE